MEIRSKTGLKNQTLSILNTYDPHMGYRQDQIETYWATLNQYIDVIPKSFIRMWRADYNGQIAHTTNNTNNIGKWTMGINMRRETVTILYELVPNKITFAQTHKTPKNNNAHLATWNWPTQTLSRQIVCFLISTTHRNLVKIINQQNCKQ